MIACYKGHYKIAQFLLTLKADVNRRSVKGNTALHDCAESGSLEILQLLLKHGASMDVDSYGMTPLLAASVTGHLPIVEHLINIPNLVNRKDRIAALELLGATYVDKKRDMVSALNLWRRAMIDRYNISPSIPHEVQEPIAAYDYAAEVTNIDQLDDLVMDPDEMRMQALVIRERILGPAHPDTSYYIRYRGAHYADAGRFDRCIELWTYALTMQQSILEPLSPMTQSSFLSFAELFSFMLGEAGRPTTRGRVVPPIETVDMLMIFNKAVKEIELGQRMYSTISENEKDPHALSRALVSALHIGCLLARLVVDQDTNTHNDNCCPIMRKQILTAIYQLNMLNVTGRSGRTALHYVCYREGALVGRYPACQFPSPALAKTLLMVGADPNAKDEFGNTPLHLAAKAGPCPAILAKTLVDHRAHLDTTNDNGDTFESLLQGQFIYELVNPVKHTSLACLAAKTIQKHGVKYFNKVPKTLYQFIEDH
ncbi:FEM1C family protein [Megaselia abdita]